MHPETNQLLAVEIISGHVRQPQTGNTNRVISRQELFENWKLTIYSASFNDLKITDDN